MRHLWIVAAVLASGCFNAVEERGDTLRARASFDLRCPQEELKVTPLEQRAAGVDGCGQRATYIFQGNKLSGTWVLNSPAAEPGQPANDDRPSPPPPAAEPPAEPPK
jgi:hypothetical protein